MRKYDDIFYITQSYNTIQKRKWNTMQKLQLIVWKIFSHNLDKF